MRILTQAQQWPFRIAQVEHDGVFWHGTPSGDLRGSHYGLHVGSYEAAREALEARIGRRADGKPWDGTQTYGETLLDRDQHRSRWHPDTREWSHEVTRRPPELPTGEAAYSDGTPVPMDARPDIFPVRIAGPMTNTPQNPYEDFKANGYMSAAIKRGNAKRGYYYNNQGEGVTFDPLTGNEKPNISAVVPSGNHVERLSREQHPFPQIDWNPTGDTGYNAR